MAIVSNKNKNKFNQVAEVIYEETLAGRINWDVNEDHYSSSDSEIWVNGEVGDQEIELKIEIEGGGVRMSGLILKNEDIPSGYLLDTGIGDSTINKIGNFVYEELKSKNKINDKESKAIDNILNKIGKNYVREKRLGKLLDKKEKSEPTKRVKRPFIDRILNRYKD